MRNREDGDVQLDPKLTDKELLFYLQNQSKKLVVDKHSHAYRFVHLLINKMTKDYHIDPETIGFIGGTEIFEFALITLLEQYHEYIKTNFWAGLTPYCPASFESGLPDRSQEEDLEK